MENESDGRRAKRSVCPPHVKELFGKREATGVRIFVFSGFERRDTPAETFSFAPSLLLASQFSQKVHQHALTILTIDRSSLSLPKMPPLSIVIQRARLVSITTFGKPSSEHVYIFRHFVLNRKNDQFKTASEAFNRNRSAAFNCHKLKLSKSRCFIKTIP
jgi:hypothetical protein